MKRILLFIALLSAFVISNASEPVLIYEGVEEAIYFYPPVKRTDDGYKVWFLHSYKRPRMKYDVVFLSYKSYEEFSKDFDKTRTCCQYYYNSSGAVVDKWSHDDNRWEYVVPGSLEEFLAKTVYEWTRKNTPRRK